VAHFVPSCGTLCNSVAILDLQVNNSRIEKKSFKQFEQIERFFLAAQMNELWSFLFVTNEYKSYKLDVNFKQLFRI
jgi:hypothetical protein